MDGFLSISYYRTKVINNENFLWYLGFFLPLAPAFYGALSSLFLNFCLTFPQWKWLWEDISLTASFLLSYYRSKKFQNIL